MNLKDTIDGQSREVRFAISGLEVRAADGEDGVKVEGYAAVFGQETDMAGYFTEVVAPGAFDAALARPDDVCFLIDHRGLPLARTSSGTLSLSVDAHGLKVQTTLDASDPDVGRIVPKMKRGDLTKMSFGFRAVKTHWDETASPPKRFLEAVELFDVSIVTAAAYDGTEIALRGLDLAGLEAASADAERAEMMRARMHRRARLDEV
ncbi:MAG: HK97 family phage prohead protease [Thioclava sp.]|nr:HK97 family phage prohead protease [Thioclava sp.]MBD3803567.1 HK97 family phage prohead protease [Thioclava sp.]